MSNLAAMHHPCLHFAAVCARLQVLLVFPVVYGFTGQAPFGVANMQFAARFFPFLITAALPSAAAMGWLRTSSDRVMRDEQVCVNRQQDPR